MKWMQCALCGWRSYALCGGWMSTRICRLCPSRPSSYSFCMTVSSMAQWPQWILPLSLRRRHTFYYCHSWQFVPRSGKSNSQYGKSHEYGHGATSHSKQAVSSFNAGVTLYCTPRCLLVLAGSLWFSASTIGSLMTRQRRWGPMFLAGKLAYSGYLNAITSGRLVNVLDQISSHVFFINTGVSYSIFPHHSTALSFGPLCLLRVIASLVFLEAPYHVGWKRSLLSSFADQFPILGTDFLRHHHV